MMLRVRSLFTIAAFLWMLAACTSAPRDTASTTQIPEASEAESSTTDTPTTPTSDVIGADQSVTEAEAHLVGEEAVRLCMGEAGFDYQLRTYFPTASSSLAEAGFFFSDAATLGYSGTRNGIALHLAEIGAPTAGGTREEYEEFTRTLHGHEEQVGDPSSNEATHVVEAGGCLAVGAAAQSELRVREDGESDPLSDIAIRNDSFERVYASQGYDDFEDLWVACMTQNGDDVRNDVDATGSGSNPLTVHGASIHEEASRAANMRTYDLLAGVDPTWAYTRDELAPTVADFEWLEFVVSTDDVLAEILDTERSAALADAACRDQHRAVVEEAMATVAADMGLVLG